MQMLAAKVNRTMIHFYFQKTILATVTELILHLSFPCPPTSSLSSCPTEMAA